MLKFGCHPPHLFQSDSSPKSHILLPFKMSEFPENIPCFCIVVMLGDCSVVYMFVGKWTSEELSALGLAEVTESPSMITDIGMRAAGRAFPTLKYLNIYNCPHIQMPSTWFSQGKSLRKCACCVLTEKQEKAKNFIMKFRVMPSPLLLYWFSHGRFLRD